MSDPVLLTMAPITTPVNPAVDADLDVLTDVTGLDGYAEKDFLPAGETFNNHHPFKDGVSDFLLFDLGSFTDDETGLNDYNAEDNTITVAGGSVGEQKAYRV